MKETELSRIENCMRRAKKGEKLTIGFFGGSITQGCQATKPENTYAYRVFTWWKQTFPQAEFQYVNGGIGGTSSHFGVARAESDLLMYQPDFVVVDFSVNDTPDLFFRETYEGVLRKLLQWPSHPAVLLLNNVFYDTGVNAQEYHNTIGDYYQVPHVSVKDTIYREMKAGVYQREELTADGLHPNDKGHELVAAEICKFLEQIRKKIVAEEIKEVTTKESTLPEAVTDNAYENAKRLTIREVSPVLNGFRADAKEKTGHLDYFKNGWIGENSGDGICFETEASCIAVQYRKTIQKPARRALLVLDGDTEHAKILDGNFEETWGDCLQLDPILHHGERKKHQIEIRILPEKEENPDMTPFYLLSLIIA